MTNKTYSHSHSQTLPDHSLHLASIKATSSGNYTCTAVNPVGRDEVVWMVEVVQPPAPPTLRVQFATQGAIHLAWSPQGDGGKPITGGLISLFTCLKDSLPALQLILICMLSL